MAAAARQGSSWRPQRARLCICLRGGSTAGKRGHNHLIALSARHADIEVALFIPFQWDLRAPILAVRLWPRRRCRRRWKTGTVQIAKASVATRMFARLFLIQLLRAKFWASTATPTASAATSAAATPTASAASAAALATTAAGLAPTDLAVVDAHIDGIAVAEPQRLVHLRRIRPLVALGHLVHPIGLRSLVGSIVIHQGVWGTN